MNFDALEKSLRKRPEGAPTDLELDRLVTGQLDPEQAREIEARAMRYPESSARLAELRRGFAAMPDVDERSMLAGIRQRLAKPVGFFSRLNMLWMLAPMAAVAVLGLMLLRTPDGSGDGTDGAAPMPEDVVRLKGGLQLQVVRKHGDKAETVLSGAKFRGGDTLRFIVSLPKAARIAIVGVEQDGELYVAWPLASHTSDPSLHADPERKAGDKQELPGAVTLDDKPGREMLYLVSCPPGVAHACRSQGAAKAPACADGCVTTGFEMQKE